MPIRRSGGLLYHVWSIDASPSIPRYPDRHGSTVRDVTSEQGWRGYGPDTALAVGVAGLLLANAALTVDGLRSVDYLSLLASAAALVAHRRTPRVVLLVTAGCALSYFLRVQPDVTAATPVLVAVYSTVRRGHRLIAGAAAAPLLLGSVAFNLSTPPDQSMMPVVQGGFLPAGWFLAAGVLGEVSRHHQAYLRQVEQRAVEAERTREETALRRASEERLRIARELHDSLTHSISIIKVQVGVAVHLARKRGEDVPQALLAIQEASRDAMRELRSTLDVLRDSAVEPAGSGLDRLDDLVERARAAGLPATVVVSGERRPLPGDVDRAAYRIVQESLTNIARHAGRASASVQICYDRAGLTVQVDDDGQATPQHSTVPGIGLTGMRKRVTALGGRLRAGPRPEGGFTVRAELPVPVPS